jgi:anti-sigma regulatory factor (Ser/Thr protein kinase)
VIVTARGPGGELYTLLADATGHGLAAAISVLPVIEAFYRLAEKGFSVASIVGELNRKVRRLMPRERFVAAAVAVIDHAERSLHIWNGGVPEVMFLDDAGNTVRSWPSSHLPLGTLSDEDLNATPEVFSWSSAGQLVMYTDGLVEADNASGDMFGSDRLQELLRRTPRAERFAALVDDVKAHIGDGSARDDISLVMVDCPCDPTPARSQQPARSPETPATNTTPSWRVTLGLEAAQLRTLDIVPLLMSWLDQLHLHEQHRGTAFIVLAELVNNAVDHGLLQLDSTIKQEPDGFERYIKARIQRLAALESGSIELSIEHLYRDGTPCLRINVRDSGPGFPYQQFLHRLASSDALPSGRGIMLVRTIAGELHYERGGSEAIAVLRLPPILPQAVPN